MQLDQREYANVRNIAKFQSPYGEFGNAASDKIGLFLITLKVSVPLRGIW